MKPTVKHIEDSTERVPLPAEPEGLRLAKGTVIKLLEYALNEKWFKKPVKVIDVKGVSPVTGIMTVTIEGQADA